MIRSSGGLLLVLIAALLGIESGHAQGAAEAAAALPPCIGFNKDTGTWGERGLSAYGFVGDCPAGAAFMAVRRVSGPQRSGQYVTVAGTCCALPAGTLTAEQVWVEEECPANYVATGIREAVPFDRSSCVSGDTSECVKRWFEHPKEMRCTKIDTSIYRLAPSRPAVMWGPKMHLSDWSIEALPLANIPAGIRHALGRLSRTRWMVNGCIGKPAGSLLVAKRGKQCRFEFSELQYAGVGQGNRQVVPVIPRCSAVSDRLDPEARCVP